MILILFGSLPVFLTFTSFQFLIHFINFFTLLLSPCCPMISFVDLGLYLSTNRAEPWSPDKTTSPPKDGDSSSIFSIFGFFGEGPIFEYLDRFEGKDETNARNSSSSNVLILNFSTCHSLTLYIIDSIHLRITFSIFFGPASLPMTQ